jgi:hypothetical protein
MSIPTPELGLVISYAYLWSHEEEAGQLEGAKDRPCVIVTAVKQKADGSTVVTVMPVTHREPDDPAQAVEIPQAVKKHLGLDFDRSWVVVSDTNEFVWPGFDLRKIPKLNRWDYGFVPPRFFDRIVKTFDAWQLKSRGTKHATKITRR